VRNLEERSQLYKRKQQPETSESNLVHNFHSRKASEGENRKHREDGSSIIMLFKEKDNFSLKIGSLEHLQVAFDLYLHDNDLDSAIKLFLEEMNLQNYCSVKKIFDMSLTNSKFSGEYLEKAKKVSTMISI
jgi:hypothetical protein